MKIFSYQYMLKTPVDEANRTKYSSSKVMIFQNLYAVVYVYCRIKWSSETER